MFHFKNEKLPVEATGKLLRKAFLAESPDQKFLYKTDIKCIWLYLFGYKISKYELQEYFEKLGKDYYKEGLDYLEFEKKALSEINRLDNVEELRNAFITVDFSCKGFLTIEDLTKQFKLIAPHLSNKMVFDVFR
jgi:Ca2+-binding EF-hand superfamily protein